MASYGLSLCLPPKCQSEIKPIKKWLSIGTKPRGLLKTNRSQSRTTVELQVKAISSPSESSPLFSSRKSSFEEEELARFDIGAKDKLFFDRKLSELTSVLVTSGSKKLHYQILANDEIVRMRIDMPGVPPEKLQLQPKKDEKYVGIFGSEASVDGQSPYEESRSYDFSMQLHCWDPSNQSGVQLTNPERGFDWKMEDGVLRMVFPRSQQTPAGGILDDLKPQQEVYLGVNPFVKSGDTTLHSLITHDDATCYVRVDFPGVNEDGLRVVIDDRYNVTINGEESVQNLPPGEVPRKYRFPAGPKRVLPTHPDYVDMAGCTSEILHGTLRLVIPRVRTLGVFFK